MARTNLAYQQEEQERNYDAQPIPLPRPKLRTIEGQARGTQTRTQQAPWVRTLVVMSAVFLVVLSTVSVARVSVANATVQMMQTSEKTTAAINQARAVGLDLEVQHSLANNPTRIQDNAAMLGILPAQQPVALAAREGFSAETISQMNLAANEARAAELALLPSSAEQTTAQELLNQNGTIVPTTAALALNPALGKA